MRKARTQAERRQRAKPQEPLAEGISRRPKFFFSRMSDRELVGFAKGVISDRAIRGRAGLERADKGLYACLLKRRLMDSVGLGTKPRKKPIGEGAVPITESGKREWFKITDEELVEYAQGFIRQKGLKNRKAMVIADCGLHAVLRIRGLLERLEFEKRLQMRPRGFLKRMSDDELVGYAKRIIEEKKVTMPSGLARQDKGMYTALRERGLMGELGFKKRQQQRSYGFFTRMDDDRLLEYAQEFIRQRRLKSPKGLMGTDGGLYSTLQQRGLLGKMEFERRRRPRGFLKGMSDDELLEYAQRIVRERKMRNPEGLRKADIGLHYALYSRRLLGRLNFEKRMRRRPSGFLANMSDDELVQYAQGILRSKYIWRRIELARLDSNMYRVLLERKLIERVFAGLDQSEDKREIRQVVEALKRFGGAT